LLDEIGGPHKNGSAIRLKVVMIKFDTGSPLDAGSVLFERLDASLLCRRKLGFEQFERQSTDAAPNTLIPIVHIEINIASLKMMVPRIGCGCERHGVLFLPTRSRAHASPVLLRGQILARPD
jgi:hypothetical protein